MQILNRLKPFANGLAVALMLLTSAQLWAETQPATLVIKEGYVREMPPGHPVTAAFMRIVNLGDKPLIFDGAKSDVAERLEFHTHRHSEGKMSMQQVPSITVPAGGEFVLRPGEYHLMLINLKGPLREGDTVSLQLLSGNAVLVSAELPVRSVLNEHHHH